MVAQARDQPRTVVRRKGRCDDHREVQVTAACEIVPKRGGAARVNPDQALTERTVEPLGGLRQILGFGR